MQPEQGRLEGDQEKGREEIDPAWFSTADWLPAGHCFLVVLVVLGHFSLAPGRAVRIFSPA
jgi:hypothetical protein